MTRANHASLRRATIHTDGRLVRDALLRSSLHALEAARSVDQLAAHGRGDPHLVVGLERLGAHREILARRAANVALAAETTAEELRDLRDAVQRLIAVQGWVARRVGSDTRMS